MIFLRYEENEENDKGNDKDNDNDTNHDTVNGNEESLSERDVPYCW